MGMMLYLRFWWECSREAWHGSWSRANALAIFGGAILAASAWWLRLTKEAPSSIEGAVGFALFTGILSLLLAWIVIFILLGCWAHPHGSIAVNLRSATWSTCCRGGLFSNEFLYGGDFGLMCLNSTGKFDIEQLRDTLTEIKVPAPANSSARIRISFMNGHQNADSKYHFYVLDHKGTPRLVKNIYEEQQVRLDARACFHLKFAHEDSYTLHDQASLRVTVSSWSR